MNYSKKYLDYLQSPEWEAIRKRKIKLSGGACEKCGISKGLQVHHLHYDNLGNENLWDLQVLCERCHPEVDTDRKIDTWAVKSYGDNWVDTKDQYDIANDYWDEQERKDLDFENGYDEDSIIYD